MLSVIMLLRLLRTALLDRRRLLLENAALRQQVVVLKRSVKRAHVKDSDRIFWILLQRLLADWQSCLLFVKPETVLRWHRRGFRYYWGRKSRPRKPGRPPIAWTLLYLIKRLSKENVLWGAPRIRDELALLGHAIAQSTVERYMVRHRDPKRSQRWMTFLRNHMQVTAACDFFVVPTLIFKRLYALTWCPVAKHRTSFLRRRS
jgi:hypothetical protein